MNKADLIDAMAKAGAVKKTQAEKSLSALAEAIVTGLAKGERVVFPGVHRHHVAAIGRNRHRHRQTIRPLWMPRRLADQFLAGWQIDN